MTMNTPIIMSIRQTAKLGFISEYALRNMQKKAEQQKQTEKEKV